MALQTTVKISGVTNLSDARYCAGMGVDLLGFSTDAAAPNYVEPTRFAEIRSWVAGVQIVAETTSTDPETIEALLDTYDPDLLQIDLDGSTEAALLSYLTQFGKPLILRLNLSSVTFPQLEALLAANHNSVDYFLLESPAPVHLDDDLLALLRKLSTYYALLLGTGIRVDTVQAILIELPAIGLALVGGDETAPGNRDFGELMDILEAIEVEG